MSNAFFESPILNSPYEEPTRHWELVSGGQPTSQLVQRRRTSALVSPIPKPKKVRGKAAVQADLLADEMGQEYNPTEVINGIRSSVESWRKLPESQWQVPPSTTRLLRHWRTYGFANQKPFFCQVEAVETVIWLTEVAPKSSSQGRRFWTHLEAANAASNPELMRMALKLATGAGKTTVMAMLIAWQTINAVRHTNAKRFSRGFLIVAPGITIKDRLRVLQPNDPESYYSTRELVPEDMLPDLDRAKIVITNYHAFKKKDELPLNKVQQAALRTKPRPESDGTMIRRVAGELMGLKNIVVLNDEAHHCYRERPLSPEEQAALKGDELTETKENNEAARLWISGLEAVKRELGLQMVYDLSAPPFFLRGSGYREGSLFGWVMSDFSLMDAIECGIVKLPRVPIMDNVPDDDTPMFRNLWEYVGKSLPKKGRANAKGYDPQKLPNELLTAIDALYGHYEKTHALWREGGIKVDPVFIVVCNTIRRRPSSSTITSLVTRWWTGKEIAPWSLARPRCHINAAVIDSDWEAEFCRVLDRHPHVLAWVKNHNLGFEGPYTVAGEVRRYRPDFIVRLDDGRGPEDPLNLVVEIKGARDEADKDKAETMRTLWVPGVNRLGFMGRRDFAEFKDVWTIRTEFADKVEAWLDRVAPGSQ